MSRFPSLVLTGLLVAASASAADLGVGRAPTPAELAAWNLDARPDGKGLPAGKGTVKQGEAIFEAQCAACHGEFGEGAGRFPELAGGQGSLTGERPLKTIGSFWPYATTVFDFIQRAMPFGNARSLSVDDTYAVVAYVLSLNDVIKDPDFELNEANLAKIHLPNENGFFHDDRETSERAFWREDVCMKDCKTEVQITGRAAVLDVTPDNKTAPKVE